MIMYSVYDFFLRTLSENLKPSAKDNIRNKRRDYSIEKVN